MRLGRAVCSSKRHPHDDRIPAARGLQLDGRFLGGPDEPPAEDCSYCDAPLGNEDDPDYEIPLILWRAGGWCARFCIDCQRRWWGMS